MEEADEKEAMRNLNEAPTEEGDVGPTTIGELIKAQMEDASKQSADAGYRPASDIGRS